MNTQAIEAALDGTGDTIAIVGGAIIALAVVALGIRWVKATFF
jgi:hypothetical protein